MFFGINNDTDLFTISFLLIPKILANGVFERKIIPSYDTWSFAIFSG